MAKNAKPGAHGKARETGARFPEIDPAFRGESKRELHEFAPKFEQPNYESGVPSALMTPEGGPIPTKEGNLKFGNVTGVGRS